MSGCKKCQLSEYRNKTGGKIVWGDGNPASNILLIGEAPGEEEAIQGKPFVGKSGQLLRSILSEFIDLKRDLFITNTVLCRPPENRNPSLEEQQACFQHISAIFHIIKPKLVITAGRISSDWLSRIIHKDYKIYELQEAEWDDIWFLWLPLYHPSYLLRKPSEKARFKSILNKYSKIIEKLRTSR